MLNQPEEKLNLDGSFPENFINKAWKSKYQKQTGGNCIEFPVLRGDLAKGCALSVPDESTGQEIQYQQLKQAPAEILAVARLIATIQVNRIKQLIRKPGQVCGKEHQS